VHKASIIFRALVALAFLALLPPVDAQQRSDSLAVVPPAPPRSSEPREALSPGALVAELRKGGYVLYFRHAATDLGQNDSKSAGPPYLEEGEVAVIKGTGGDFDVVARVRPGAWPSIVSAARGN
jgi:hypothetical protein